MKTILACAALFASCVFGVALFSADFRELLSMILDQPLNKSSTTVAFVMSGALLIGGIALASPFDSDR